VSDTVVSAFTRIIRPAQPRPPGCVSDGEAPFAYHLEAWDDLGVAQRTVDSLRPPPEPCPGGARADET
jgi:hypothetical protein